MKKFTFALLAAAAAIILPEVANATTVQTSLTTVQSQGGFGAATTIITYAAYVLGAMFVLTGLMKLRAHVDNPAQTPLKDALGRLTVGALLGVTPFIVDMFRATTAATTGTGSFAVLGGAASLT